MTYKCKTPAVGQPDGHRIKTVCLFDDETHGEVRAMAEENGTSLAEQVRILVEIGIETLKAEQKEQASNE